MLASRRAVIAIECLLFVVAAVALGIAVVDWRFGGYEFHAFEIRFASRHALKPVLISLRAAGVAVLLVMSQRVQPRSARLDLRSAGLHLRSAWLYLRSASPYLEDLEPAAPLLAALAALIALAVGITFGTYAAVGADCYGYVSQSMLWSEGSLHVQQPVATIAPWPNAEWSLSPLGYRPATTPGAIVPIYSPGLPMVMALLAKIGGPSAVYLAVPALGAVAVWCTFVVGRTLEGWATGLLAAILVAACPVFLFSIVVPMSDVAVTGWWMAAIALVTMRTGVATAGAGIAAAAALLTRPNLLPLGLVLAAFVWLAGGTSWRARSRALLLFALGFLPGCLAVAWIFNTLYGSPLMSGYGRVQDFFRVANIVPNLQRYSGWVIKTGTPFIWVGLAAPMLLRHPSKRDGSRFVWFSLAWIVTVLACYLPYVPSGIRFLMPALPVALLLSSAVTISLIRRLPAELRVAAFAGVCLLLVPMYIERTTPVLALKDSIGQRRAVETAKYIERDLTPGALALAQFHSGSVRYYAGRQTIQWANFAPEWLDRGLVFLRDRGYVPYIVLEDWEEEMFRTRFAKHSVIGALDWPPLADIEGESHVRIYDPRDRDRHIAGEKVETARVTATRAGHAESGIWKLEFGMR